MQELHSKILGSGHPLLILHGFLGMSDNWKTLGSQYADNGFEVHLIDQRNHGKSFHSDEFNYQILANDLHGYINANHLVAPDILGHSMGGKTAMQFACSYPNQVNKLIVADIAPKFYPPHHQYIVDALTALEITSINSRKQADEALSKHLSDFGIRQFLLKNLHWVEKGKLGFRFNLDILKDRMEEIGENLLSSDSFEGHTLFVRGDRSEYISDQDINTIKSHFPSAVLKTVENAGHWLHAENPKQFFEITLDFLIS
ncbi:alpha/beta fold hydrolase [Croceivirga thetidis]|uniref:Alpha/beta fold hydrolase n=1 Tax=Croceivirga thetidis TaxID=2721623 RepID=A0ABX1GNE7_9FLAO|nr:alpha/beta fold hydrolase [Croceivirga thetidis]NKI30561.1 alpha/beta fold hydrolase [Croceivirga thetidis]